MIGSIENRDKDQEGFHFVRELEISGKSSATDFGAYGSYPGEGYVIDFSLGEPEYWSQKIQTLYRFCANSVILY